MTPLKESEGESVNDMNVSPKKKKPKNVPVALRPAALLLEGINDIKATSNKPAKMIMQAMWVSFDKTIVKPIGFMVLESITAAQTAVFANCLISSISEASNGKVETLAIVSDSSPHCKSMAAILGANSKPGVAPVMGGI